MILRKSDEAMASSASVVATAMSAPQRSYYGKRRVKYVKLRHMKYKYFK